MGFWISYLSWFCSQKIKLSLFLLLVGVGIASVTDLQLNLVGTVLSLLAIITTCVGQIVSFFEILYRISMNIQSLMILFLKSFCNSLRNGRVIDAHNFYKISFPWISCFVNHFSILTLFNWSLLALKIKKKDYSDSKSSGITWQ